MSKTLPSERLQCLQDEGHIRGYTIRSGEGTVVVELYAPSGKQWEQQGRSFTQTTFGETLPPGSLFRLEDLIEDAVEGIRELTARVQLSPLTP